MEIANLFAVDWGTSNLRVWAFAADGREIARLSSDKGTGGLRPDEFEPALLGLIAPYLGDRPTPVLCCGMVGARQGWAEAAYASVPCAPPDAAKALQVTGSDPRLAVSILPGVMQQTPPDVMRGEETQIAGFLAQNPGFDGTLCLPGTHSKWVQVSAGEIVSFRTFMTGELFALISGQSVLRHSVGGSGGWSDAAFAAAVDDAMGSPQQVAARLFGLRAAGLVGDADPGDARAQLSGLLIGLELAGARPYWLGQDVALIGDPALTALYATALDQQAVPIRSADGGEMTLAGLQAAHNTMKEVDE